MKQLYFLDSSFILTYNENNFNHNYDCYKNKSVEFSINNGIEILIPAGKDSLIHCGRVQLYNLNDVNALTQEDINNYSIEIAQRLLLCKKYLDPQLLDMIEKYLILL